MQNNNQDQSPSMDDIIRDQKLRMAMARKSLPAFVNIYFGEHIRYPFDQFHMRWMERAQDRSITTLMVSGFRNSGKSTLLSQLFPLWAVISDMQIKSILIVTQTTQKAEQILRNIRMEFETNSLFIKDFGRFKEEPGPWNSHKIYIKKYKAWIQILSTDQNPRGLKDGHFRPELIIMDDMESLDTVRAQKSRDDLYNWHKSELVPAGADNARYIFVGTPIHPDSLFSRLKKEIETGEMGGVCDITPIVDDFGNPTWSARYPTKESVEQEKFAKGIPDYIWNVEYMLKTSVGEDQIILSEHIHYYDPAEPRKGTLVKRFISVDPAGKANPNSDYTGIVVLSVYSLSGRKFVYVDAVYNEKKWHDDLVARLTSIAVSHGTPNHPLKIYIESVNFEPNIVVLLKQNKIPTEVYSPGNKGKDERLISIAVLIELGYVLFPKDSSKVLVDQLLNFGRSGHDDLVDALTQGVIIANKSQSGFLDIAEEDLLRNGIDPSSGGVLPNPKPPKPNTPGSLGGWVNLAWSQSGGW